MASHFSHNFHLKTLSTTSTSNIYKHQNMCISLFVISQYRFYIYAGIDKGVLICKYA